MKHSFKAVLTATCIAALAIGCKKEKEEAIVAEETPPVAASITIEEPISGVTIEAADTVWIHVDINRAEEMHGYEAMLINLTTNDTVWDVHEHDHGTAFHIEDFWVNNVTDHSDMRFKVIAILDHEENETVKTVDFHCHP